MLQRNESREAPLFLIVTGLSGAGKSTAIKVLEDLGFYCVDNLPLPLMDTFVQLCLTSSKPIKKVALGIDIREKDALKSLPEVIERLEKHVKVELLFLEASDKTILQRFKETRRPHPLSNGFLEESVNRERLLMAPIRALSHYVLETSGMSPHALKSALQNLFEKEKQQMSIFIYSFGFKYGVPPNLDLMIDVRFLPNPYFVDDLRDKTGLEREVEEYVLAKEETREFIKRFKDLLDYLLPKYQEEGKPFLCLGIGCTGGVHRSVVLAQWLSNLMVKDGYKVRVHHCALER